MSCATQLEAGLGWTSGCLLFFLGQLFMAPQHLVVYAEFLTWQPIPRQRLGAASVVVLLQSIDTSEL